MKYLNYEELRELVPPEYSVEHFETLECLTSTAAILRHTRSGARIAVFVNDDDNKLFSAAFRTAPEDDCGTPHIIEHSVLCGSERYPVKDPFMQLVKSSMQTFLNAMTYADKTVYPVSSCNDADFVNLSNIYLDAVFAPNISRRPEIFMQEGWHYEPTDDGGLDVSGVVYSEMMGAMSSPDSNVYDGLICALFPDNAYGKNSGGDPDYIPSLTYEQFLDFYTRHYHPSNCYITLYGNMDMSERLTYIDREYLSKYDAVKIDSGIVEQAPFGRGNLRRVTKTYPIAPDESAEGKSFLAYGAVCADSSDVIECMAFDFLSDILVESPGAPIKSALVSAGIGQEIYGGFLNHIRRPAFSVIAKNTEAEEADRFMKIINDTLNRIAVEGVNRKSLLAAIERSEFRFREGDQGGSSRGLGAALSMLQSWIYTDDDPFAYLRVDEILAELRRLCDTDYYEKLVARIANADHAALFTLKPEAGLNEKRSAELKEKLSTFRDSLSDGEYAGICESYERYTEYQDREETEEELSCIPMLSIDDISRVASPLYIRESTVAGIPAVFHDVPTNGIAYVRLMFDVSHVPNEDLVYLDILSSVLGKVNTVSHRYEDLLDEIRLNTGGFGFACEMYRRNGDINSFRSMYEINLRVLSPKFDRAVQLVQEIIYESDLNDTVRIREILSEMVSEKQRDIVSAGSEYATARALAYFSPADAAEDYLDGITAYFVQRELLESFDKNAHKISGKLRNLLASIFTKRNLMLSITVDEDNISNVMNTLASFAAILTEGEEAAVAERRPLGKLNEGFLTTSKVQYAAIAGNLTAAGFSYRGEYQILASVLKNDYLYPEIRMKGGAYGYTCSFSVNSGNVCMATYRDPCLAESYRVFTNAGKFISEIDMSESELTGHIIGTFGKLDRPMSAYMKASRSLAAYMSGRSYDDISRDRLAMLNTDEAGLRSLAESVDSVLSQNYICVIGNEEKILENKHLFENIIRLS